MSIGKFYRLHVKRYAIGAGILAASQFGYLQYKLPVKADAPIQVSAIRKPPMPLGQRVSRLEKRVSKLDRRVNDREALRTSLR